MDQALEKEYNKPAKEPGGIIGIQRQKEIVAKWNLMKHEKKQFTTFLDKRCRIVQDDEYSLHHEFSYPVTKKDQEDVDAIKKFMDSRSRYDVIRAGKLTNMSSGC